VLEVRGLAERLAAATVALYDGEPVVDAVAFAVPALLPEGCGVAVTLPLAVIDGEGGCDCGCDRVALPLGVAEAATEPDREQLSDGATVALTLAEGEVDGATTVCDGDTGGDGDAVWAAEVDERACREADGDSVADGVGSAQLTPNT
jgi:hypothetical protein